MIPAEIGLYHPQVVHFVIALLFVGVIFRIVSFTGKLAFTGPAATTLIIIGTVATQLAIMTGDKARPPVERIPGVRHAVQEHEEWADRTRQLFVVVSLLEVAGLVLLRKSRPGPARGVWAASTLVGLLGLASVYETAEHGGAIVYEFAGGPGIRSGKPEDVQRLYIAGLYNQAMLDRKQGRKEDAARRIAELARILPNDETTPLLLIESQLRDEENGRAVLNGLDRLPRAANARQQTLRDIMRVEAHVLLGYRDSARTIMNKLKSRNPDHPFVKRMADSLQL